MNKQDKILVMVVLVLCIGGYFLLGFSNKIGNQVVIRVGGDISGVYDLRSNQAIDVIGKNGGQNHVIISNGKVYMETASCQDQICVKHGEINRTDESIVCLPHEVVIEIGDTAISDQANEDYVIRTKYSKDVFAMDTYMSLTAYGEKSEEAVEEAARLIEELENKMSTKIETSEIAQLNSNGKGTVSDETAYLIERSMELYQNTLGAFDITIYPVVKLWGFTTGENHIPETNELQLALWKMGIEELQLEKDTNLVTFRKKGMEIDLGGIAKGYTSTRIIDLFREFGITSGVVSLGGNVQVLGNKENGDPWNVAIRNPNTEEGYLGVLKATDQAVITSGGYERYFEEAGETYHHIIDPATGYPADSGLISVTIVSSDGTLADTLSTAVYVMGKEKAIELWKEKSDEFDMILLEDNGRLAITEGIAEQFTSEYEVEIIES